MQSVAAPKWREILASMHEVGQRPFAECQQQGAIAKAGRGGGKSYAECAKFHRPSAAHPGGSSVFVAVSSERARDILLPGAEKLNEKFQLGINYRAGDNALVWPNGYRTIMRGCRDRTECNKRRGTPWVAAGWDECDSLNQELLKYDIHECVEPRLMDYDGKWFAAGTPGPILEGYWYELSNGINPNYPMFEWTALNNPFMRAQRYFLDTLQRMNGVPANDTWPKGVKSLWEIILNPAHWHLLPATFVREYLGRWVTDLKALIYRLGAKNSYGTLPIQPDYWTIGCDLGGAGQENPQLDHAAITVAASHTTLPYIWVPESFRLWDITVDSLALKLSQMLEVYPEASVYIDSSSAGKIIENSFRRMGIPIQAADKGPKLRRIQLLQSRIAAGTLQFHMAQCMDLRRESTSLVYNEQRNDHSKRCADDCWDSAHYAIIPHISEPVPDEKKEQTVRVDPEFEQAMAEAQDEAA